MNDPSREPATNESRQDGPKQCQKTKKQPNYKLKLWSAALHPLDHPFTK